MRALSIDAKTKKIQEIDITMEANTIYSFFSSILIDELAGIHKHIIYTDANALSEYKDAYFIGEHLVIGDALIIGKEEFNDIDASIPYDELLSLVRAEVNPFYATALEKLASSDINLYRSFFVEKSGESIPLNIEWVLYTFNIAAAATQEYFLAELTKALNAEESVEEFMQKMATLALQAGA